MSESDKPKIRARAIASIVLADGAVVEMIYRRASNQTAFLEWRDGLITEYALLDDPIHGRVVPYAPENNLLAHDVVLFPSGASDYASDEDLRAEVGAFIHRYADLSATFEEFGTLYVMLSWVYDAFSELPYGRLKGDFGSGKTRILQTIGSLCYKPMFVSGASTVSPMFRIIDSFRGTLILDESDFRFSDERQEIVKILNNGNAKGFPVLRSEASPTKEFNPRAFTVFGPKIIATRRDFDDRALESRCITEVMAGLPPRKDIPLSLPDSFHDEAREIRNKLLMYRFRNLHSIDRRPSERKQDVEARVAQVYAPLLAVARTDDARERLIALAKAQSRTIRAERDVSTEAQLLDTIYGMRTNAVPLTVKNIAAQFIELFSSDYTRPITPRWIGSQLRKRLSLNAIKSHGVFLLPPSEEGRLIALFERYGIADARVDMGTSGMLSDEIAF